jgi:hypothetical protein
MAEATQQYELTAADRFSPAVTEWTRHPVSLPTRLWSASPFLFSLILHLSVLVGMAACGLAVHKPKTPPMLLVSPAAPEAEFESVKSIKIDSADNRTAVFLNTTTVSVADASSESIPSPLTVVADSSRKQRPGKSLLSQVNGLFDGLGQGRALDGSGEGAGDDSQAPGGAEFFGVHAAGTRFVFVVDSSRSMRGRKWATACRELLDSVARLNGQQSFYVIFFDVDTHPMFDRRKPERQLIPVTTSNQKRLKRWLPSIKLGVDTRPLEAMRLALRFKPDAIFLLSDGEFADPTRNFLLLENVREADDGSLEPQVPVHTVGFHSFAAQAVLRPIAIENGGVYRFVPGRKR